MNPFAGWREEGVEAYLLRRLVTVAVLIFPSACMLVDKSDSACLLLLGLAGVWIWIRQGFRSGLSRQEWLLAGAYAGFFLTAVLAFYLGEQTDEGFRLLGRYLRFAFALPALIVLRRYRPSALIVWAGLGVGALLLGVDGLWERLGAQGFLRPEGDTNLAILFGDLALLTAFCFAAGYVYIDGLLPRLGPWLMAAGVISGLSACFLSGARGAWVAVPVLLVLFLGARHVLRRRTVVIGGGAIAALFAALYLLPQSHVQERLTAGVSQVRSYWHAAEDIRRLQGESVCLDQADVLQEWLAAQVRRQGRKLMAEVVTEQGADAQALAAFGCAHGAVLHVQNGATGLARLWLPRSMRPGEDAATTLFVRGRGELQFAAYRPSIRKVSSDAYRAVQLTAPARFGRRLSVEVPGGKSLWLAPRETAPGEYRYTLMRSSIGQRLEMWYAAARLFRNEPLFGAGTGAFQHATRTLIQAGAVAPFIAEYDHPHDDYWDALSSRGLVGLLALLALLGVPAWLFTGALKSSAAQRSTAGLGGLLVVTGFAVFGLTETMFIHSVAITWYVIMTLVFHVLADDPGAAGRDAGQL